jgi:hypothetical protein
VCPYDVSALIRSLTFTKIADIGSTPTRRVAYRI